MMKQTEKPVSWEISPEFDGKIHSESSLKSTLRKHRIQKDSNNVDQKVNKEEFTVKNKEYAFSVKNRSEVERYKNMLENEKKFNFELTETVKDLNQKNQKGGKLLKSMFQDKKELEIRVKGLNDLCGNLSKIQKDIVELFERELEYWSEQLESKVTFNNREELESTIVNLKERLQTDRKMLRGLYMKGQTLLRLGLKNGPGSQSNHDKEPNFRVSSPRNPLGRNGNTIWRSHGILGDEKVGAQLQCSNRKRYVNNEQNTFEEPWPRQSIKVHTRSASNLGFVKPRQLYKKVRVLNFPSVPDIPELLTLVCNIVFYGHQVSTNEEISSGVLEINFQNAITTKQLQIMTSRMVSLQKAMRNRTSYGEAIDKISLEGVPSRLRRRKNYKSSMRSKSHDFSSLRQMVESLRYPSPIGAFKSEETSEVELRKPLTPVGIDSGSYV